MLGELFQKVLDMSLIGCYSILIVMAVRVLLSKFERRYTYYLWFVVFLNLCIPFSFQGVFSLIPSFVAEFSVSDAVEDVLDSRVQGGPDDVTIPTMPNVTAGVDSYYNFALGNPGDAGYPSQAMTEETTSLTIKIATGVWLAGIAAILIWSLAGMLRLKRQISRDHWIRFSRRQGIAEVDDLDTPFLWGILKPTIYLPTDLEPEEMRYIVAHEQFHKKRKDYLIKIAVFLVAVVHWFNPLVWAAYTLFCRDMEISCDEAVLLGFKGNIRKQYAGSLLKYAARQSGFILSPITFGEPAVKTRIKNVLRFRKRGIMISVLTVICVISVSAGLVLRPSAQEGMPQEAFGQNTPESDSLNPSENNPTDDTDQQPEPAKQGAELSEQDAELINMAIHDNEHNIYTGNIGNEEIRMLITRTGDSLYAAYTTRSGAGKVFQGNLANNTAGFVLNTDDGEYLNGLITETDDGYFVINGEGELSQNSVTFTLYQESFITMGDDLGNYYSFFGYNAEEAERFAQQIKDSISDKTAFAGLIQYPISVEMDGTRITIENEEGMVGIYDRLMEQNGFRQQIERAYTKFMFANYMGICIEDGMIWFSEVGPEDYKITAINPPQYSPIQSVEPSDGIDQELENLMTMFYTAYFNKDIDAVEQYLSEDYQGDVSVVGNEINSPEDIEILEIKGWKNAINKDNVGDECELSLECRFPNEDSYTYLTVGFIREESGWKIIWYGLEK